jgi:hypothetical protein
MPEGAVRLADPISTMFWVSWQDNDREGVVEDGDIVGADAAIAWGRERSDNVVIRLGHREGTFFWAGDAPPPLEDGEPLPLWPPVEPLEGWWVPSADDYGEGPSLRPFLG